MSAINGGKPTRKDYLQYGRQYIDDEDIMSVIQALKSDFLTTGPLVEEFERKFADYVGAKYAVAVSNGTAALHIACLAAGLQKGDEGITTPITFAASSNCMLYCGAKPVFCDINLDDYNIDENKLNSYINENTKVILPVDFTGQCCNIGKIMRIAKENNLIVIQDASHSLGTKYLDKQIGSIADMTTFSLHPVKTITSGEGGVVTTNSLALYEKLKLYKTHGITKSKGNLRNKEHPEWYYEQIYLGYNYRITDLQSALGISQLSKIEKFIEKRKKLVNLYNKLLKDMDGIILQKEEDYSDTSRHLYIIRLDLNKFKATRDDIYNALIAENIGVNIHYIPVYKHPYYKEIGYEDVICENAETLYNSSITLPLHVNMDESDINDVVNALKDVLDYYKR
ncbi:UDP-4-keto-6-deoxy-N-acetylglucosamine 4-aminotransferase [[Clostridium] bifermentans ATCC 638]|uniref:UDP-4-keto-6-deoxy-N-acetylglucosamine 4-aminotransferase n=1 Tax=Paraclostridium bifermentans ATCC 638 = DSM 14991 TaxID=1233171 RepID=T4VNF2_PARBF|nr:UDP-4-amino-4,6-dideoxy-N-acetyl-beta-L-altrosamine transaminase [Paraclostridium bifermentans]EQK42306.1 UDP-4-keto-6-deoxy-N-acetylglucosamine 4-aminotransferase [[Clostridium] bifermentans ATCC 638] [Paraclostridium bifermentans ATCC 638 = DSM 14991]RIZ59839.1 UDP-4-amino-4,6-dideoxy-N-acetyl-beta-L-altrosamine transaminase [Paraclostridium bifermentans]UAG19158.1 UDP-4-amino-4,6-dideoxy-N-acetyl-beta-L-altrosamine transaminase [Paraclostridium bifermentans]